MKQKPLPCLPPFKKKKQWLVIFLFVIRLMSFDLEIAGTLLNGSCHPMGEGNVVLSYRIGTSRQWKIIGEYPSVGKWKLKTYISEPVWHGHFGVPSQLMY